MKTNELIKEAFRLVDIVEELADTLENLEDDIKNLPEWGAGRTVRLQNGLLNTGFSKAGIRAALLTERGIKEKEITEFNRQLREKKEELFRVLANELEAL